MTTSPELLNTSISINIVDVDSLFDDEIFKTSYTIQEADFERGSIDVPIFADGNHSLKLRLSRAQ